MGTKRTEEERAVLESWPVVTGEDIEQLNDLFRHYIFFRFSGKEADKVVQTHTTCCGRRDEITAERRVDQPWERELMQDCAHGKERRCPWCGKPVTMKDLKKAGKRHMLRERQLALVLHGREDALCADAVVLWKGYETEEDLTAKPQYYLSSGYRFSLGDVMQIDYQIWSKGDITHERGSLGRRKLVQEPFKKGSICYYSHEPYYIVNREELEVHPAFRYCGYFDKWAWGSGLRGKRKLHSDFVEYMTAYCIYPRQVEMFVKVGYQQPVADLMYIRKKNADAIDWNEPDARKALGLDKRELHQFMAVRPPLSAIAVKKYVAKHWGKRWSLDFCVDFANLWGIGLEPVYVLSFLRRFNLDPERFLRYLGGRFDQEGIETVRYADMFDVYRDYIEASYMLGRCMEHSAVLWPRQLFTAHDEATGELAKTKLGEARKGMPAGARKRKEKYEFELDGLRIVFPMTANAIKREGRVLSHCVGGYAERHMKGVLDILFLRRSEDLSTPYVTIEMRGNSIQQIHGYGNDKGKASPRTVHKKFLDTWLAWLKRGSPRNEDGTPKLPKKRKEVEVA